MRIVRLWALVVAAVCLLVPLPEDGVELAELGSPVVEIPQPEAAPIAEDITMTCALNGYWGPSGIKEMRDGRYQTHWESAKRFGIFALTITAPEGKTVGGVQIKWFSWPVPLDIQAREGEEWVTIGHTDADFVAEYIPIPDLQEVRLISQDGGATKLEICEITVMTPGALPEDFQIWRKAPDHVDMMLIAAHPDDEVLWFGGLLPTYAGEQGKDVLLVNGTYCTPTRRLELLDCLWTCGVDIYPAFLNYYDAINWHIEQVYEKWGGEETVIHSVVEAYRRYRPDVVVLHAVKGESGHGAHQVLSDAGREAISLAADPGYVVEAEDASAPWQVKKVYVHLWEENQIVMDWHVPLERFGGLDGLEVAVQGFEQHVSQQKKKYRVVDGGETDNSLFGLYDSVVGLDEAGNDMFEHIPADE